MHPLDHAPVPALPTGQLRADGLPDALALLGTWKVHAWAEVSDALQNAPVLLWQELTDSGLWPLLPEHEQAGVCWVLAEGWRLGTVPERFVRPLLHGRRITALAADLASIAARHSALPGPWPHADPHRTTTLRAAVTHRHRLIHLGPDAQAAVLWLMTRRTTTKAGRSLDEVLARPLGLGQGDIYRGAQDPPMARSTHTVLAGRLARLPAGWQVETLRRIAAGELPASAIYDAQQAINTIRRNGIHLAWCAAPDHHPDNQDSDQNREHAA